MTKVSEMIPGKYLRKDDVGAGVLVTIHSVSKVNVAVEGAEPEFKYAMSFLEIDQPLILNTTNIRLCEAICGSDDSDHWVGKKLVLYNDPNISFAGKITGGIRVRKPKGQTESPPAREASESDLAF